MKFSVNISSIQTVNEVEGYWTNEDMKALLGEFDYPDAASAKPEEIEELLFMAISDFEPPEAANKLLSYKLKDHLNQGQIDNMSHEMLEDKIAEEYPDTSIHYQLFNVNQLLYKAYNGKFPNTEATIIDMSIQPMSAEGAEVTEEIIIKCLSNGLTEGSLVLRLFEAQLSGEEQFSDAVNMIWDLKKAGDNQIKMITSNYWMEEADFGQLEYDCDINIGEE